MGNRAVTQSTYLPRRHRRRPPQGPAPAKHASPENTFLKHKQQEEASEEVKSSTTCTTTRQRPTGQGICRERTRTCTSATVEPPSVPHALRTPRGLKKPECTKKQVGNVSNTGGHTPRHMDGVLQGGEELSHARRRHIDHPLPLT